MTKPIIPDALLRDGTVHLTPITSDDLELIRTWRNRDEIRIWFNDGRVIEPEQQRAWYRTYVENPSDLMFLVRRTADAEPVGTIALYRIDLEQKCADVGRLIVAEGRGEGLGYATLARVSHAAFAGLGIEVLHSEVKSGNIAALRINHAVGFRSSGVTDQDPINMHLRPEFMVTSTETNRARR